MKTDVARQPLSFATLQLLLICAAACLRAWLAPWPMETQLPQGVLLGALLRDMGTWSPLLCATLNFLFLLMCAFEITRIGTRNMLYVSRTMLPIVFYTVTATAIFTTPHDTTGMLLSLLFIRSSQLFVSSFRRGYSFLPVLRAGLIAGVMPLVLPASLSVWIAAVAALLIFRRSWREAVVCAAGLLLPVTLCAYGYWICGESFLHVPLLIADSLMTRSQAYPLMSGAGQLVLQGFLLLLFAASAWVFLRTTMRTRPKRIARFYICATLFFAAGFLLPCRSVELYPLVAAPLALVAPFIFVRRRGAVPATVYITIVATAMVVNIVPLLGI
jgi:hypothetical protein